MCKRILRFELQLKVDVPILPCVFYTFNWLILTSEMYFVRFHPEVTSCLLSRGKTKYATLGMRLWCKYIRNYLLVYQLISHFLPYLWNYKEFEGEILDLQLEKYGLSFETKKYTTSGWARGDENVIGIRAFNLYLLVVIPSYLFLRQWKCAKHNFMGELHPWPKSSMFCALSQNYQNHFEKWYMHPKATQK